MDFLALSGHEHQGGRRFPRIEVRRAHQSDGVFDKACGERLFRPVQGLSQPIHRARSTALYAVMQLRYGGLPSDIGRQGRRVLAVGCRARAENLQGFMPGRDLLRKTSQPRLHCLRLFGYSVVAQCNGMPQQRYHACEQPPRGSLRNAVPEFGAQVDGDSVQRFSQHRGHALRGRNAAQSLRLGSRVSCGQVETFDMRNSRSELVCIGAMALQRRREMAYRFINEFRMGPIPLPEQPHGLHASQHILLDAKAQRGRFAPRFGIQQTSDRLGRQLNLACRMHCCQQVIRCGLPHGGRIACLPRRASETGEPGPQVLWRRAQLLGEAGALVQCQAGSRPLLDMLRCADECVHVGPGGSMLYLPGQFPAACFGNRLRVVGQANTQSCLVVTTLFALRRFRRFTPLHRPHALQLAGQRLHRRSVVIPPVGRCLKRQRLPRRQRCVGHLRTTGKFMIEPAAIARSAAGRRYGTWSLFCSSGNAGPSRRSRVRSRNHLQRLPWIAGVTGKSTSTETTCSLDDLRAAREEAHTGAKPAPHFLSACLLPRRCFQQMRRRTRRRDVSVVVEETDGSSV